MSLATSCPSCGTVFKVVEDQLKVSEGWVRCGHCHDVFNALEGLFDLQRKDSALGALAAPAARDARASSAPQAPEALIAQSTKDDARAESCVVTSATTVQDVDGTDSMTRPAVAGAAPEQCEARGMASHPAPVDLLEADTVIPSDAPYSAGIALPPADGYTHDPWPATEEAALESSGGVTAHPVHDALADEGTAPGATETARGAEMAGLPSFVHHRPEQSPWVGRQRHVASAAAAALGLALVAQVAWHWREELAVRSPAARIVVQALASTMGHPLGAPTKADAVEVENAALTHPAGAAGYKLSVQVRNRVDHEVAAPHMELSLTDANGALLARRVLRPTDFQQATSMSPQGEATWSLEFQADDRKVAGYTVLAFYP